MNLSKNFALAELIEAGSARRLGLDEQFNPSDEIIINLTKLCCNVLQPLREAVGHSIIINSGYRSPKVNKAVGGAKNSDHLYGYAADISLYRNGKNCNQELYDTILKLKLPFRQMIDEFGSESEPAWIHISYNYKDLKRECLRARKVNGKTKYTLL
jgi:zinc D-Ala-D-Ala carboxypeptidase